MSKINREQKIRKLSNVLYSHILDDGSSSKESSENIFDYVPQNQLNNDILNECKEQFESYLEELCNEYAEILTDENFKK